MTIARHKVAGIVLAGGQSSRMGQDKALLCHQRQTLLQHSVARLARCGLAVFVSGAYPDYDHFVDRTPALGPLSGLDAALHYVAPPFEYLLLVPVDMPALTEAAIEDLLQTLPLSTTQCAYFAQHPLPVLLPRSPLLQTYIQTQIQALSADTQGKVSELSIKRCLAHCFCEPMIRDAKPEYGLCNINTPDEWQEFQQPFNLAKGT